MVVCVVSEFSLVTMRLGLASELFLTVYLRSGTVTSLCRWVLIHGPQPQSKSVEVPFYLLMMLQKAEAPLLPALCDGTPSHETL